MTQPARASLPQLSDMYAHHLVLIARIMVLARCLLLCDAFGKLFEPKSKKIARLTAELAALEAERLSKFVVVFGYEFDKLGFYTSVSISAVLFVALIIQLGWSRRKWKKLALSGGAMGQSNSSASSTDPPPAYNIMLILGATIFFIHLILNVGKAIESKSKSTGSSSDKGSLDVRRISSLVIVFGKYELDKTTFYALLCTSIVLLVALGAQIGTWTRHWWDEPRLEEKRVEDEVEIDAAVEKKVNVPQREKTKVTVPQREKTLDVVIVGCGPKSVGWFHLMQFLDMPNITVRAVVEPFYLDKTKCPHPPPSFVDLVMMLDDMRIRCLYHVGQMDIFQQPTLCVIAGRTSDNPRIFRECIGMGATHIYLESPGAPTIEQLKDMQSLSLTRRVEVYMGYQRLCASYIEKAMALSRTIPKSHVFFCHNETYPSKELNLVVSRFPEGMIRSMTAQELAVLVTQLGVKADQIKAFKVNSSRLFSERRSFYNKNNGKMTDFSRVAFKITTKDGRSVSVMADRCGGLVSFAVVKTDTGKELKRFESHNEHQASMVEDELREDKEIMHQFIIESEEYLELKKRVVKRIISEDGSQVSGLVSIHEGIDVMVLADYCAKEVDAVVKAED